MANTVITPRDTPERSGQILQLPVKAATKVYVGTLGAIDASGNAVYATDTAGLIVVGRIEHDVDNSAGAAGDLSVNLKRGVFKLANSASHAIAAAQIGDVAYVEDEQTVTVAAGSTNRVKAGIIVGVDTDGVWIDTRPAFGNATSADTLTALTFSSTPTQAEVSALRTAVLNILIAQNLVV